MDRIIAAVRAAISAITRTVWVTCKVTGRLIMKCVPDFGASAPVQQTAPANRSTQRPAGAAVAELARQVDKPAPAVEAIRTLAQKMAGGTHSLQDMHQVPAEVVQWMSSLDRVQLCRLVCAKPQDLAAYMNGRTDMRGLPPYLVPIDRPAQRRTADRELAYSPSAAPAM